MSFKRFRNDDLSGAWGHAPTETQAEFNARHEAGRELRNLLLDKHMVWQMPAPDVCLIAHLATKSGTIGCEDLALDPSTCDVDKHASAHIRLIVGREHKDPGLYYVNAPIYNKTAGRRDRMSLPLRLPTEILSEEYAHTDIDFSKPLDDEQWHPAFTQHPVYQKCQGESVPLQLVLPVAMYWDGIMYTKRDNVLVFTIEDLRKKRRHIIFILRSGPRFLKPPAERFTGPAPRKETFYIYI
jgi:hypothetical protein